MDYKNGKIYCIRSHKTDLIYIGSTCQPLYKRLNEHKKHYKAYIQNGKNKYSSYKIYELDDTPYIELIINYPCSSKNELNREEGVYIRSMDCVNRNVVGRTKKEHYDDNKERILKKNKEYKEDNKDKIKQQEKEYREANKEKIKEKDTKKFTCICGCKYTRKNKARHERTAKHKQFIN